VSEVIRPLADHEERLACVALQETIWGPGFADRVPASVLMIAQETGGVVLGGFEGDRLVGFVFGITGLRDGAPVHWSDMLAVHRSWRGRGIGRRLKLRQREVLLDRGVRTVLWTFDPLEARNGHLNLRRLGARSGRYRRDLYGRSDSPLHAGIGTDRLVVEWALDSERVRALAEGGEPAPPDATGAPVLNPPEPGVGPPRPGPAISAPRGAAVRVAVPADIQGLKGRDLGLAAAWRRNVRSALERCLDAGYEAVDLERGEAVATYVLLARDLDR
jgi:predicted GNAT superfamily acetyltransferase